MKVVDNKSTNVNFASDSYTNLCTLQILYYYRIKQKQKTCHNAVHKKGHVNLTQNKQYCIWRPNVKITGPTYTNAPQYQDTSDMLITLMSHTNKL